MAALAGLGILLLVSTMVRPLHVDELRQTSYYSFTPEQIVWRAYSQEQPPLDYLIGAWWAELTSGPAFVYRLPAVIYCLLAAVMLVQLLQAYRRSLWNFALPVILGLSPVFLAYGAYARPYALPLFLMICALYGLGTLQTRPGWPRQALFAVAVLALPYSRTTEPPLFLAWLALVLLIFAWRPGHRWLWGALALVVISGLNAGRLLLWLSKQTADYQSSELPQLGALLQRLMDFLLVYVSAIPAPWLSIPLAVAGLVLIARQPEARRSLWWLVPLLGTVASFPLLFALAAKAGQGFAPRYTFFAIPIVAVLCIVAMAELQRRGARWSLVLALGWLLLALPATARYLLPPYPADYLALADEVHRQREAGLELVFEPAIPLGRWRPRTLPGNWRSTRQGHQLALTSELLALGRQFAPPSTRVGLLLPARMSLDGWQVIADVSRYRAWTTTGQRTPAEALGDACRQLEFERAGLLCAGSLRLAWKAPGGIQSETSTAVLEHLGKQPDSAARRRVLKALPARVTWSSGGSDQQ